MADAALDSLRPILTVTLVVYMAGMYGLGIWSKGKVENEEDYLVAGRRLPFSLSTLTLLATWFGAENLLGTPDEVRRGGLRETATDPLGMGLCLVLGGLLIAGPLWRMGLLTLGDFFRVKFGKTAEFVGACILVPSYFGWIGYQFVALAQVMHYFFGWDPSWGLAVVAVAGVGYTLLGGMWSVTVTDSVQMLLIFAGLGVLAVTVFSELGDGSAAQGLSELGRHDAEKLIVIPRESRTAFLAWLNLLAVGALGNLPGQDLAQRMFAAKSPRVAQTSCVAAGVLYWSVGLVPVLLALAADLLFPGAKAESTLPMLAGAFLNPFLASVFVVVILSAVLSTVTSAILSPAGLLAQNILRRPLHGVISQLRLNRICVVFVAIASLLVAYSGERAVELLEGAYEMTLVSLLVPLLAGIFTRPVSSVPAVASMVLGIGLWLLHFALGLHDPKAGWDEWFLVGVRHVGMWRLPAALSMTVCSLAAYLICDLVMRFGLKRKPIVTVP